MRKVWLTLLAAMTIVMVIVVPVTAADDNEDWFDRFWGGSCPAITQPTDISISQPTGPASKPESGNDAKTPVSKAPVSNLTADENAILEQVNAERAKAGLVPLTIDTSLVKTARAKSQDMIDNGYFDHESPVLGSLFDQLKHAGISYRYAGENIAGNSSVVRAMEDWMNSPGHRANILNPNFTHIGIGVVEGGRYGKMLTQQFIG